MAQYQITLDSKLLHQLFLGNSQDSGVAAWLESVLNQVSQAQATNNWLQNPMSGQRIDEGIEMVHIPINSPCVWVRLRFEFL